MVRCIPLTNLSLDIFLQNIKFKIMKSNIVCNKTYFNYFKEAMYVVVFHYFQPLEIIIFKTLLNTMRFFAIWFRDHKWVHLIVCGSWCFGFFMSFCVVSLWFTRLGSCSDFILPLYSIFISILPKQNTKCEVVFQLKFEVGLPC